MFPASPGSVLPQGEAGGPLTHSTEMPEKHFFFRKSQNGWGWKGASKRRSAKPVSWGEDCIKQCSASFLLAHPYL